LDKSYCNIYVGAISGKGMQSLAV